MVEPVMSCDSPPSLVVEEGKSIREDLEEPGGATHLGQGRPGLHPQALALVVPPGVVVDVPAGGDQGRPT